MVSIVFGVARVRQIDRQCILALYPMLWRLAHLQVVAENDRLTELVLKQKPGKDPLLVALGFGIGTLTSLGIFAISTEIVK